MSPWKIRFWGTRGSIPAPGPDTLRYGGNTSCVEMRCAGRLLILDSGTGIRSLGLSLVSEFKDRPIEADILVGHTHWDHIQGFPFFVPAYLPRNRFRIYSAQGMGQDFEKIFLGQMSQNYFPVEIADMAAEFKFMPVNGPFSLGDVQVKTTFSNHPGVNIVYRLEHAGRSVVYLTDHENYEAQAGEGNFAGRQDKVIEDFCRGADLLIADAQYTDEEYSRKRGWGHSRWRDTLSLALKSGVKRLALYHHEPTRTDEELDAIVTECRGLIQKSGKSLECFAAKEGQELFV